MDGPHTTYGQKLPLQNSFNLATSGKVEKRKAKNYITTWRRAVESVFWPHAPNGPRIGQ